MATVKYEGTTVSLGGREFVVPALSLKRLKKVQTKLETIGTVGSVPTPAQIDVLLDIILIALQRNYPDMALDDIEEDVDLANLMPIFEIVLGASGIKRISEGKA